MLESACTIFPSVISWARGFLREDDIFYSFLPMLHFSFLSYLTLIPMFQSIRYIYDFFFHDYEWFLYVLTPAPESGSEPNTVNQSMTLYALDPLHSFPRYCFVLVVNLPSFLHASIHSGTPLIFLVRVSIWNVCPSV